jgi:F-type H+-transporting ATPase subunit b
MDIIKLDLTTLLFQIANFLLLLFLLNVILFRPIRKIMAQRREETGALEGAINDYLNQSNDKEKGIEEGMAHARKEGFVAKEDLKNEGFGEEKAVLQSAHSTAEEKIAKAREEMESRLSDVRKDLEIQMATFSKELAEKVLGRSVQ